MSGDSFFASSNDFSKSTFSPSQANETKEIVQHSQTCLTMLHNLLFMVNTMAVSINAAHILVIVDIRKINLHEYAGTQD